MNATVSDKQLLDFYKMSSELYRRITVGTLPVEHVLAAMRAINDGRHGIEITPEHLPAKAKLTTLAEMLKVGCYDDVNSNINQECFPVRAERFSTAKTKLFSFGRTMKAAHVEMAIKKEGYEPAMIEQLLAYGMENPEEQMKYYIVALGSSWLCPIPERYVPHLGKSDRGQRCVGLSWHRPDSQWGKDHVFLAVAV